MLGGDKNHISVSAPIASVYIKISLVLLVVTSSWKLIHSAPNLFGVIYFQAIKPLCDQGRHGQHSLCLLHFSVSKCLLLEFLQFTKQFCSGFYQFFSQAAAPAASNFLNSDFIFNSGSLMKRLNSRRQRCTKIPFFHDNFP